MREGFYALAMFGVILAFMVVIAIEAKTEARPRGWPEHLPVPPVTEVQADGTWCRRAKIAHGFVFRHCVHSDGSVTAGYLHFGEPVVMGEMK